MVSTSSRVFKILATIVALIVFAVAVANVVYFGRLRGGGTLSSTEISSMFYFNIALGILALIILLYGLYVIFVDSSVTSGHYQKVSQFLTSERGLITATPAQVMVAEVPGQQAQTVVTHAQQAPISTTVTHQQAPTQTVVTTQQAQPTQMRNVAPMAPRALGGRQGQTQIRRPSPGRTYGTLAPAQQIY